MPEGVALALALAGLAVALAAAYAWTRARQRHAALTRALKACDHKLEQLQIAFARFAPASIVEEVIRAGGVRPLAERREVTVLFVDIVGFTTLSESMAPERLVALLNGYFSAVCRAITRHHGHVSKFIGDGVMAVFGAPERNPWQAIDATRAALAVKEELARYNEALARDGHGPLNIGVGVHRGPAVAGIVGNDSLADYTVIGDTVNTAARVEGLAHEPPYPILISDGVARELDARFTLRALPDVTLRGKHEPLRLHAVEGYRDDDPAAS